MMFKKIIVRSALFISVWAVSQDFLQASREYSPEQRLCSQNGACCFMSCSIGIAAGVLLWIEALKNQPKYLVCDTGSKTAISYPVGYNSCPHPLKQSYDSKQCIRYVQHNSCFTLKASTEGFCAIGLEQEHFDCIQLDMQDKDSCFVVHNATINRCDYKTFSQLQEPSELRGSVISQMSEDEAYSFFKVLEKMQTKQQKLKQQELD